MPRKPTDYNEKFRLGWHPNENQLTVWIPDKFAINGDDAFLWVVDGMHVRLSAKDPGRTVGKPVYRLRLQKNPTTPGCRIGKKDGIKLTGKYFRPGPVVFQQVMGGDYQLTLPHDDTRQEPVVRPLARTKGKDKEKSPRKEKEVEQAPAPQPSATVPGAPVTEISVYVSWTELGVPEDAIYSVPVTEIAALAKRWSKKA